jgi:hypothetical protein
VSKAHFAEMEILIKLGAQKECIIFFTKFAEKLPVISSHPWWLQAIFTIWI